MLVLTRRPGEKLLIGDDIVVTILEFGRGQVKVGIDAPKDVLILREEIANVKPLSADVVRKGLLPRG